MSKSVFSFLKSEFPEIHQVHRIFVKSSAEIIFRHQKSPLAQIAPEPLKTKLNGEENPPRIHFSAKKSLFRKKSLLDAKVAKVRKSDFRAKKLDFSSWGPKKHQRNHCPQAHLRAWARKVTFGTRKSQKVTFKLIFAPKVIFRENP